MNITKEEMQQPLTQRVEPMISKSERDAQTPGVQVEHTADEAEANGAFKEMALSEADAWESNTDLRPDDGGTAIPFPRRQAKQTDSSKLKGDK